MGSTDPRLSRHIADTYPSLDGLFTAAEAAQALVESAGWPVLLNLLDKEISTVEQELEGKLLDSRAAYARAHGRISGLRAAPALLGALIDKADAKLAEQRVRHEGAAEPVPQEA